MNNPKRITRGEFLSCCGKGVLGAAVGQAVILGPNAGGAVLKPYTLPWSLELDGKFTLGMDSASGIALQANGDILVAGEEGVRVYTAEGAPRMTIETAGPACCVAVGPEGTILVGQRTAIETFDPQGKPGAAWGTEGRGPGEFSYLTAIAAAGAFVYAADSGNRCIHRFAADGDFVDAIQGYEIPSGNPACQAADGVKISACRTGFVIPSGFFDVAVDQAGELYVGHTGRHRVERYDRNNLLLGSWGQFGSKPGEFCGCCNPTNLAVFSDGRVATAEKGVPRLQVFDREGKPLAMLDESHFPGNAAGMDLAIDARQRVVLLEPVAREIRFYALVKTREGAAA